MRELSGLKPYLKRYLWRLLPGIFFVILSNIAAVYVPMLVRMGFDETAERVRLAGMVHKHPGAELLEADAVRTALVFAGLILFAAVLRGFFMYLMRQYIINMSRYVEYDLKNDLFRKYQRLPLAFFRRNFTGDLMARMSEDVGHVRMFVGPAVMYTVNFLFTFLAVVLIMFYTNATLSMYVLLPLPLMSYSIYKVSIIINKRSTKIQQQLSRLTTFAQETFSGIRVIKSFGAEGRFRASFYEETDAYYEHQMSLARAQAAFFPLMMLLVGISTLLVVYLGGNAVAAGTFTYGNIAEFLIYLNMLIWPMASLGWVTALVQRAAVSQGRINEFMREEEPLAPGMGMPFRFNDRMELKDVSFTFPDKQQPALEHISLNIKKGSTLGVLGQTGSGKSTLAALMMRLYDPQQGSIAVDGKDLKEFDTGSMRQVLGYVPQDIFLFSESIFDNIAFGLDASATTVERIERAARMAGIHDDIMRFPQGYQTMLGERGVTLSGGQKQRVAIARALAADPELILLDDCLSAVDARSEALIIANLKKELKDKTAIIISHRVQGVMHADHIVVLKDGHILEQGTHQSLMDLNGSYARLHRMQVEA